MENVELYIKANAAKNGKGLGDCPLCQRIMMILKLKGVSGKYIPVNLSPIQKEFKEFCQDAGVPIKVPILKHEDYVVYNPNDIAYYIDKECPEPVLKSENEMANKIASNLFTKFSGYLKNKNPDPKIEEKLQNGLLDELKKLNNFLSSVNSPGKFLDGDQLKHPDCDILPKLLHVKVALKKYKNFEIPDYLPDLLAYMEAASQEHAFSSTRPEDDAIIEGWRKHFY